MEYPNHPFFALAGQEDMKTALPFNAIRTLSAKGLHV